MAVRRILHLDRIHLPKGISPFQFLMGLVVPGCSFLATGHRFVGWSFIAVYGMAVLVLAAALGFMAGAIAYGVVISAHAMSVVHLQFFWLREQLDFRTRLILAGGTLLAVWMLCYQPLMNYVGSHWFMPLRMPRAVVVVNCRATPGSVKTGDWIAFRMTGNEGRGYVVRRGFGVEKVLAVAGDKIVFTPEHLEINGVPRPRLEQMPTNGEWVVPEKHWFVWPNLAITTPGHGAPIDLEQILRPYAMIGEDNLIGKPFTYWFGRRQLP
jgi:signal peptidase I